jgi:hypothetical protein
MDDIDDNYKIQLFESINDPTNKTLDNLKELYVKTLTHQRKIRIRTGNVRINNISQTITTCILLHKTTVRHKKSVMLKLKNNLTEEEKKELDKQTKMLIEETDKLYGIDETNNKTWGDSQGGRRKTRAEIKNGDDENREVKGEVKGEVKETRKPRTTSVK